MIKFSKGDKSRVISVNADGIKKGIKVGDIVTVNENSCVPYCILPNGEFMRLYKANLSTT